MSHQVPGISAYPDLVARFDRKLGQLQSGDNCGGCKIRELVETFTDLVRKRQKRDNDFRKR